MKTAGCKRNITLPPGLIKDLDAHRQKQRKQKLKAKVYHDHGFVFANSEGNPLDLRNLANRCFRPLLKKAGLPEKMRLYDLRHCHATMLLQSGEHPKIVSERLGHSSTTLTMDVYSHVLPDMQQSTADKLQTMLFEKKAIKK